MNEKCKKCGNECDEKCGCNECIYCIKQFNSTNDDSVSPENISRSVIRKLSKLPPRVIKGMFIAMIRSGSISEESLKCIARFVDNQTEIDSIRRARREALLTATSGRGSMKRNRMQSITETHDSRHKKSDKHE